MAKSITDIPEDILITMRVRMYALGALVWDYTDTVLDIARSMRIQKTKKTSRKIRALHADYDYTMSQNLSLNHSELEMQWAMDFETYVMPLFQAFIEDFKQEQGVAYDRLEEQTRWLMIAVQQALCVLDALKYYTLGCDLALAKYGVDMRNKTTLSRHFRTLGILLPEFGTDTLVNSEARKKAAGAIAKALAKIVVADKDGDLEQPEI